jgi:two-component system, sensor histidine kinase YesM
MKDRMINYYRKISIKKKLSLIAVLFIVYPIVILGYFGYKNYANVMKEKAIRDSQNTARELAASLEERMEKLRMFSIQIFYDRIIYDACSNFASGKMDFEIQNNFQQYLQSTLFSKYELDEILISFKTPKKVFHANRTLLDTTESFAHMEKLHEHALKGSGRPMWYVSHDNGKVTGIYIAKIIYDLQEIRNETGMLVFKVNSSYLFDTFNHFISHTNHNLSVYSEDGLGIFINEVFKLEQEKPHSEFLGSEKETSVQELKSNNDTIYMLYDSIQSANWKLVIGISSNVLLKEVRKIAGFILLLCFATLPICLLLIDYMYISIIRPLNLLIKRMHAVEQGDIGITIVSNREDEFGYVFRTFNKMSLNIKSLIDTVYKKQLAMKDAEIKALQAQINPHFLFNTLEAINWKARMNGVDEISDMISAFSNIIEANMNRTNEKFISISKEIDYINNYTFLIQKRFGKKIMFNINMDEQAAEDIIPKLLIQPIVENAIFHGLEMKKGHGTINIKIEKIKDILSIQVTDDGLGIEENTLSKLKEAMADDNYLDREITMRDNSSIGVLNVHRRIRLLYGKEYGVEIHSHAGEGTVVLIKLPAGRPKGDSDDVQSADN